MRRRLDWLYAAAFCAASLGSATASADDEVCRRAYVETQRLQRAAHFRAARREAVLCGQYTCSETVRAQCTIWLESIERALPTLLIDARDGAGSALVDVRVEADGELLAERLSGRALELDPGETVLRFSHGEQVVEQRTLIRESEKYRTLAVRFEHPPESSAPAFPVKPPVAAAPLALAPPAIETAPFAPSSAQGPAPLSNFSSSEPEHETAASIPMASYLFGGFGLVSLTTFAVLGLSGYASERHLRRTCAGACESDAVDAVRTRYLIADAALGAGVSALVAATAIWIWTPAETIANGRLSIGPRSVAFAGTF